VRMIPIVDFRAISLELDSSISEGKGGNRYRAQWRRNDFNKSLNGMKATQLFLLCSTR